MNPGNESDLPDESIVKRKRHPIIRGILFFLTFSVFGACLLIGYVAHVLSTPVQLAETTSLVIPSGSSVHDIANQLQQEGVIENADFFKLYTRLTKNHTKLKAGEYKFEGTITLRDVLKTLESGEVVSRFITIPEGLMTSQILAIIENTPYLKGAIPEGIEEGSLLPETYDYHLNESRENLIMRMQKSMQQTIDELWETRIDDLPIKTKREAIILASIVEKETGMAGERQHVASVFINRLRIPMRLQSDPTTIYAITKGAYKLERPLTFKDLEIEDPYNTYHIDRLPPGPIANPGKDAIAAVLNPLETDDLYFVADGTGGHAFAKTLKEHNRNVQAWRKINRKRQ